MDALNLNSFAYPQKTSVTPSRLGRIIESSSVLNYLQNQQTINGNNDLKMYQRQENLSAMETLSDDTTHKSNLYSHIDQEGKISGKQFPHQTALNGSSPESSMVLVSRSTLNNLRDEISASVSRMKDLEDQVKVIPNLQRTVDMMLSNCSNGFSTTNSQRSTPSITSFDNLSNKKNQLKFDQQSIASTDNLNDRSTVSSSKVDFDELINDLISLSYSVNYLSSASESTNTLASNTTKPKDTPVRQQLSDLPKISTAKPGYSPYRMCQQNYKPTSLRSVDHMDIDRHHKNCESCPPLQLRANLELEDIAKSTETHDMATNTDLFMDDIITRSELNQFIRKQTLHSHYEQNAIGPISTKLGKVVTHDIAVDCNMRTPTNITNEPSSSDTTSLFENKHSDTGYDTYERCEVSTQVDKNIWGIMNYLHQEENQNSPSSSLNDDSKMSVAHVTTILINQPHSDDIVKEGVNEGCDMQPERDGQDTTERVKISVKLAVHQQDRCDATSFPTSITPLPFATSEPTNGQLLFSESTSIDEDSESCSLSRDSEKAEESSSSDETSISDEEGEISSLGSYQDPSDFEEYKAFSATLERNRQHKSMNNATIAMICRPSKELEKALKYLADHLKLDHSLSKIQLVSPCLEMIRKEWFELATRKDSCHQAAKVYLTFFESFSKQLLNTVVNLTDAAGNSVIHYAASHFNFKLLDVLLDTKVCDMNRRNKAGYTPIMLLALAEIEDQFQELVAKRIFQLGNVNIKAHQNGQTALMLAASHGRKTTCKLLLECGADPSLQDHDGSTALMCGSEIGHVDIVKDLVAHRLTDLNTTDNDGLDALAIAMNNGHRNVGLILYAAKNMFRTRAGGSGVGASLRRSSSKSTSLYLRRADSLISPKNRPYKPRS